MAIFTDSLFQTNLHTENIMHKYSGVKKFFKTIKNYYCLIHQIFNGHTCTRTHTYIYHAIFSTQDVVLKHIREGDTPYLCFFDLEKAFDSIEYPVLLSNIFKHGKCFRLIKDWYTDSCSIVRINNKYSQSFPVHRGVKQGSVLSPTLFIAVMDSLLRLLENSGQGLTISGLNVGSSAHADDVRAACNSIAGLQTQANLIASFCDANDLSLNANKTELIKFSSGHFSATNHNIAGQVIPTQPEVKCLGVWWHYDLSPTKKIFIRPDGPGLLCSGLHWCISWETEPSHWSKPF